MDCQKTILPNKLRVLTIPMSVESVTALVLVRVGSRYETRQNNGISHFLEHMAFKGTKKRPSTQEIATLIDGIGGEFNAFTGKEATGFYIKAASAHLPLILDVLSDMLLNSCFDPGEIEKERKVILEEINLYEDTPARKIIDLYEELLYGDHPLGWDTAGKREVIAKLKRVDFLNFLENFYSSQNMVVTIAGGVKGGKVPGLVAKYLGNLKPFDTLSYKKVRESQKRPQVKLKYKKTEQAHLCLGVRTFPLTDPDRFPLAVLTAILGEGMSSRLFLEVRERRGLSYYVRSFSEHYLDCGTMFTQAGVDLKRIEEGIKVIIEEYGKLKVQSLRGTSLGQVRNEELVKAKEYLKGHLILELEDSRTVASFFGTQEILERKIRTPPEIMGEIEKVTVKDLGRVARNIFFPEKLNLAIIGPFRDRQKFENLLNL